MPSPKKVPKPKEAKPGRMLMELDKAGSEWVICAYASGDPRMMEVCRTGKSPHTITGSLISGLPEELVVKENKIVGMLNDPTLIEELRRKGCPEVFEQSRFLPRSMSVRQCGKKSNHGLNFDMGAREFSDFSELEEHLCKQIIQIYKYEAYTYIPLWHESVKRELRENGRVLTDCFGRKRRFLDRWDNQLWKAGYAYIAQSTNVDMVNGGLIEFFKSPDKNLRDYEVLAQVHDSLLFNTPVVSGSLRDIAAGAIRVGLDFMRPELEYGGRKFHVETEMKVGLNWGNMVEIKPFTRDVDQVAKKLKDAWELLNDDTKKAA